MVTCSGGSGELQVCLSCLLELEKCSFSGDERLIHRRSHNFPNTLLFFSLKEKSVLEEIDVIVASLLDILLRTVLETSSRPQPASATMRLQFQDVTVRP